MTEERADEAAQAPAEGVFGNLPRSRPGSRSPRRDAKGSAPDDRDGRAAHEAPPRGSEPTRATASESGGERPRAGRREPGEPAQPAAREGAQIAGVEDLAWAGVAVAAEAATLGVRLAGRALEAMRDAVERR